MGPKQGVKSQLPAAQPTRLCLHKGVRGREQGRAVKRSTVPARQLTIVVSSITPLGCQLSGGIAIYGSHERERGRGSTEREKERERWGATDSQLVSPERKGRRDRDLVRITGQCSLAPPAQHPIISGQS